MAKVYNAPELGSAHRGRLSGISKQTRTSWPRPHPAALLLTRSPPSVAPKALVIAILRFSTGYVRVLVFGILLPRLVFLPFVSGYTSADGTQDAVRGHVPCQGTGSTTGRQPIAWASGANAETLKAVRTTKHGATGAQTKDLATHSRELRRLSRRLLFHAADRSWPSSA